MSCTEYRDELVAYVRRELTPLAHQRLSSHLGHCESCRAAAATLAAGLRAAREYDPVPTPGELEALSHRLSPYVEAAALRRAAPRWLLVAGALAAATVALALVVVPRLRVPGAGPRSADSTGFPAGAPAVELSPTAFVRVIADSSWDGAPGGGSGALTYRMTRGAAGFAFDGGEGRSLTIETPVAAVRAVGTRFAVAVGPGGDTVSVSVGHGEVAVECRGRVVTVDAGEEATFGRGGELGRSAPSPAARALLDHASLGTLGRAERRPSVGYDFGGTRIGVSLELAVPKRRPSGELVARLERAEALAAAGDHAGALAIYGSCAREPDLERAYADLCRLEAARIVGFAQGDRARARVLLAPLARAGAGEARRQARLALCELARIEDPCRGVACLRALAGDPDGDEGARREAGRLAERWGEDASCPAPGDHR